MVENIDLDGSGSQQTYERVLIPEDSYLAVLTDFSETKPEKKMQEYKNEDGTITKKEVTHEKQRWLFTLKNEKGEIIMNKENNPQTFPMFIRVKVSKAPKENLSNTKMYDILEKADLLGALAEQQKLWSGMDSKEKMDEAFQNFLKDNLANKGCKVVVETVNKGKKDKEYSVVKNILRFGA